MKASVKILFLLLGIFCVAPQAEAQIFEIMSPGISNIPPGHHVGSSFGFSFRIKNNSGQSYTGSLITLASVNGSGPIQLDSTYATVAPNGNGNTFDIVIDSFPVTTPPFILGANGVVVWVVDDTFNPISNADSTTTVVTDQPSFMLTPTGIIDFPESVVTEKQYDFAFRVSNVYEENYNDTLFFNLQGAGHIFRIPSSNKVRINGDKSKEVVFAGFEYLSPPFELGYNPVKIWVDGTNGAVALDTLDINLDVASRTTVGATGQQNPGVLSLGNPSRGPIVIRTRPGIGVKGLQLYNLAGQMVFERQGADPVDLVRDSELGSGMYWLSVDLSDASRFQAKLLYFP